MGVHSHAHTNTHQALRCLESRDRAVSISSYTHPEDLISQWIHVKCRLSSTSSPTDPLPTLFSCRRPPERKRDGSFSAAPSATNISHIIFSQPLLWWVLLFCLPYSLIFELVAADQIQVFLLLNSIFSYFPFCGLRKAECFHFSAQHMINAPQ